jgi:hypothetical protein
MKNKHLKGGLQKMRKTNTISLAILALGLITVMTLSVFTGAVLAASTSLGSISAVDTPTLSDKPESTDSDDSKEKPILDIKDPVVDTTIDTSDRDEDKPEVKPIEEDTPILKPKSLDTTTRTYVRDTSTRKLPIVDVEFPILPSDTPVGDKPTLPVQKVEIIVSPEKQTSETGQATYKIVVRDNHEMPECPDTAACALPMYKYELAFNSETTSGSFSESSFELGAGQSKTLKLNVIADQKGSNYFKVTAFGKGALDSARGLLVVGEREYTPEPTAYFIGSGFTLNEDESIGYLVSLNTIKKGEDISGRFNMAGRNFKLEGTSSNSDLVFNFVSPDGDTEGAFKGQVETYSDFLLLKGIVQINGKTFDLTAISKRHKVFADPEPLPKVGETKEVARTVSLGTVATFKKPTEEEVYFRPVRVTRTKIFGFIPNPWGEKKVEIESTDGTNVVKKTVKAFESAEFNDYKVEVGSLDSEDIELKVTKA